MTKITRKIPSVIATQHPDHGNKPFWKNSPFIHTIEETKECFLCLKDLEIDEYMWDWEGKLVDESVLERIIAEHFKYFQKYQLGKEKFLTFRLPNPKVQHEFRLARALMGILTAAGLARQTNLHTPPLFEVILPMTETAKELINIQEAFKEIACLRHPLNRMEENCEMFLEIIPLFENVDTIINSNKILEEYLNTYKNKFKSKPVYLRPFVARSDPALNSGIVPTILAIKIAFSRYRHFAKQHKIPLFPIIGTGTLPFRGGLNPKFKEDFAKEYKGVRTATIQSAFRYDFSSNEVKNSIQYFKEHFPKNHAEIISQNDEIVLKKLITDFENYYKNSIENFAPIINKIASYFPKRRERVQHIGLFGYSRGSGKVKLPRAITFTGSLYSLGIPPELIGTGRGIKKAMDNKTIGLLEKYYVNLKKDLIFAGGFLYKPGLIALAKKSVWWKQIWEDVQEIENYLLTELGPKTPEQKAHYKLCEKIHKQLISKKPLTSIIETQAVLRKSLG